MAFLKDQLQEMLVAVNVTGPIPSERRPIAKSSRLLKHNGMASCTGTTNTGAHDVVVVDAIRSGVGIRGGKFGISSELPQRVRTRGTG